MVRLRVLAVCRPRAAAAGQARPTGIVAQWLKGRELVDQPAPDEPVCTALRGMRGDRAS